MDVYPKDESKVVNVEMQAANHGDLPRRSRYYQAAADIDTTPKGSEYKDLKRNYVIFICIFDPFGQDRPIYKFHRTTALIMKSQSPWKTARRRFS